MADAIWNNRFILADPGKNETVLYNSGPDNYATSVTLPESRQHFEYLKIIVGDDAENVSEAILMNWKSRVRATGGYSDANNTWVGFRIILIDVTDDTHLVASTAPQISIKNTPEFRYFGTGVYARIYKVVGVNRVSGDNS